MTEPIDAWEESPEPEETAAPAAVDGGEDGRGFLLSVTDVLAQIAEEAEPIKAGRWRSLVMHGKAPAPLGWVPAQI